MGQSAVALAARNPAGNPSPLNLDPAGRLLTASTSSDTAGTTYTKTDITISAGQAAGTTAIAAANAARRSIQFGATKDFSIDLAASSATGQRIFASARDGFSGQECPTNAIYLVSGSGLIAGDVLTVWEG